MSWDDLAKNKMKWPSVSEVHEYRKRVYQTVSSLIGGLSESDCANITLESPLWALVMSFEHERIHLETSSVLMTELPKKYLRFPKYFPAYHSSVLPASTPTTKRVYVPIEGVHFPSNSFIQVEAQKVTLGKPTNYPSFGWDNEYGFREFSVPAFKASKFQVSNGEFLSFVKDGGYARRELWSDDGWKWRAFRNVKVKPFLLLPI